MWRTAMAGGFGGWYGFFERDPVFGNAQGYDNSQALKTHKLFWENRFLLELSPQNNLSTNSLVLSGGNKKYVFFGQGKSVINANLNGMAIPQVAIAVDTKKAYKEVTLGQLESRNQNIQLPYKSDWVIAVGL